MFFPSEVLIKIFTHVNANKDILSLMLTCKLFCGIIDNNHYYKTKLASYKIPYLENSIRDIYIYKEIYKLYSLGNGLINDHYKSFSNVSRECFYDMLSNYSAPTCFYFYKLNKPIYPLELYHCYDDNQNGKKMEYRLNPDIVILKPMIGGNVPDCENFILIQKISGEPIYNRIRDILHFDINEFDRIFSMFRINEYYLCNTFIFSKELLQFYSRNDINFEQLGLVEFLKE